MADEVFEVLPLQIDPQTKTISSIGSTAPALEHELASLNALHRALVSLENTPQVPPPPIPVNPKRSANVSKLRESGNDAFKKGKHAEAVKFYSLGLQMALTRPLWEPQQLVREEVAALYANRAQAHMGLQSWAEGAVDALTSVEAKRMGNAKAWWRRGKCLAEMGRLDEARDWIVEGLEVEGDDADLVALVNEIQEKLSQRG
jgi:translocation protein SEC72